MNNPKYWIEKLELVQHPEGGWYREVYKSEEIIKKEHLPERFSGDRRFSTSIYFLLKSGDPSTSSGQGFSAFHRIRSDEIWHFYKGSAITIHVIDAEGNYSSVKLGKNFDKGEVFQFTVPRSTWFAAEVNKRDSFALVGCTVSPGFHFDDFELGEREELLSMFPQHKEIITGFTK